jgi:hypothetical protein
MTFTELGAGRLGHNCVLLLYFVVTPMKLNKNGVLDRKLPVSFNVKVLTFSCLKTNGRQIQLK